MLPMTMSENAEKFHVYVDDNARYMDESCRRLHGVYATYEEAYRVCRSIVEDSVRGVFDYDNAGEENYSLYLQYGESPWIVPDNSSRPFSAFDNAREYIQSLIKLKPFLD